MRRRRTSVLATNSCTNLPLARRADSYHRPSWKGKHRHEALRSILNRLRSTARYPSEERNYSDGPQVGECMVLQDAKMSEHKVPLKDLLARFALHSRMS